MALSILTSQALLLVFALHAALIGASAGAPLWRALPRVADVFELRAFFALALGLAIDIALIFVLGLSGGIYTFALVLVGLASAAIAWARVRKLDFGWLKRLTAPEIAVAVCFYVWVAAAAIKVPGHSDDTLYHLPLARFYAETHGLGLERFVRFPLFPQNMEMLFTLALALQPGSALFAEGVASLPAFVVALGLVGAGRCFRDSRLTGVAAGVIFLGLVVVDRNLGYAYIDNGLALFCFAAALGAVLIGRSAPLGAFALIGLLVGTACGCKVHALAFSALIFLLLVLRRGSMRALAAFAATAAIFGLGWYVRSFVLSGDPLSPAGGPWFGYFLWDAADLAGQKEELATHGVGTSLTQFPLAFIKGGANWLLPGLLAAVLAWRQRAIWSLWALLLAYALFWFYAAQVDRYLAPALAVGALLTAVVLCDALRLIAWFLPPEAEHWFLRPEINLIATTALLAIYVNDSIARASSEVRNSDRILARQPGMGAIRAANAARARFGDPLVQIGFEGDRYFYDGEMIGDWFGPGRYRQFWIGTDRELIQSAELRATLERHKANLLALNPALVKFDVADYRDNFDVLMEDSGETLLALKPRS